MPQPNSAHGDDSELHRFITAQESTYGVALEELKAGRKRTHWMWFIFPQFAGLGTSSMAQHYAIKSADEARGFLAHPLLGPRMIECAEAILGVQGRSANQILGSPDDLKLRSCATLFAYISPAGSVFHRILDKYYSSEPDPLTLDLLRAESR